MVALFPIRQAAVPPVVATIVACVDSGASRSFFPMEIATRLGLTHDELEEDEHGGMGVEGEGFPTWSSTVPIAGWIVALFDQGPSMWGPRVPLNPAFSEKEPFLLGRHDFFKAFTVTFAEHQSEPVFHLDYGEGA